MVLAGHLQKITFTLPTLRPQEFISKYATFPITRDGHSRRPKELICLDNKVSTPQKPPLCILYTLYNNTLVKYTVNQLQLLVEKKRQKLYIKFSIRKILFCSTTLLLFHLKKRKKEATLYDGMVY